MPNYLSRMKPNGANGTEYKLKDEELREVVQTIQDEVAGTQTATGNPITLTDGSETYAQGLSVELEPKQDLHGYDYPWVGGAGKNKFDVSKASQGKAMAWNTASLFTESDSWVSDYLEVEQNTNYIANKNIDQLLAFDENKVNIYTYKDGDWSSGGTSGNNCSSYFSVPSGVKYIRFSRRHTTSPEEDSASFQLEIGTTSTTFAPYSNICPITGYTECEVESVGVNQWDEEWEVGSINTITGQNETYANQIRSKNYTKIIAKTFYCKFPVAGYRIFEYDKDKNYIKNTVKYSSGQFTVDDACEYIRFIVADQYGTTYHNDVSLNYPSTDTNYHPYQSRTASVTFGQTVYGGRSNFTDGGTDDEYNYTDLGSLSWTRDTNREGRFYTNSLTDVKTEGDGVCEALRVVNTGAASIEDNFISFVRSYGANYIFATCKAYSDASAFTTAMTGIKLVYEKATPTTIDTPPTDLKLLQDTNNLTTNGTTITLDYIPNNSIGDAVKASEEYTDRAVERVAPKATLIDTWMISDESGTISVDLSYDCNFFLFEYVFHNKKGTTLIPRPQGSFSVSVVTYYNGSAYCIELDYNPTTKVLSYTSNLTSEFGVLGIYTI